MRAARQGFGIATSAGPPAQHRFSADGSAVLRRVWGVAVALCTGIALRSRVSSPGRAPQCLPVSDGGFDRIVATFILVRVEDLALLFREVRRALGRERFDLVIVSAFLGNDVVPRRIERYP